VIWSIPDHLSVSTFARDIGCIWVGAVPVTPDASCEYDQCHTNVDYYILSHGGHKVSGYYYLESLWGFQAIYHSVWESPEKKLIDITPFKDSRKYNIFSKLKSQRIVCTNNIYSQSLDKYFSQETDIMYYVYALIDPRNNMPFYIGKGKGHRAMTHLWEIPETRNQYKENKIASIRSAGLEPRIEYLAEDIIDEEFAYNMEKDIIARYGRKGYESHGILTNICLGSSPPNHKGKTYEEIYGTQRSQQQKSLRSRLQKERGGYGPKKHQDSTKKKISERLSGSGNGMWGRHHSEESKNLIRKNRSSVQGEKHPNSKHWILTSPSGQKFERIGNLGTLCDELGLSFSTMHAAHLKQRIPNRGTAKGWSIISIDRTEKNP